MGSQKSKEVKAVDATGNVNNNFVIDESVPVENFELKILIYIICIVKILQFLFFVYKFQSKRLKRKYIRASRNDVADV